MGNDFNPSGLPITAALDVGPAHGTLTLNDGSFLYPDGQLQQDRLVHLHGDRRQPQFHPATVTIRVLAVNDFPVATTTPPQPRPGSRCS